MKRKSFFALAALSVVFVNCTREELASPISEPCKLTAIMESDDASTRAGVTDEGSFTWASGDVISVFTSDGNKVQGTLSSGAGESTATFQYTLIGDVTATGYAVYPHHSDHSVSDNTLSVTLPSSYALGDGMDNTNAIMAAVPAAEAADETESSSYSFKHLGGVFRFVFKNVPAGVDNFVLSLGGNKINGVFASDLSADEPVIATSATETESEKSVKLTFTALTEASDITLYVPVPTGTYTGISASLNAGSETKWSYSSDNASNTISRRSLKVMPKITIQTATGDIESSVASAKTLQDALNKGGKVVLDAAIEVTETLVVPEGVTVELDLNGKALTASNTTYVLNNLGNLTIVDSEGTGYVSARGIYNGQDADGNHVTDAKLVIESGTYNALGTDGGAAVFNYGIADINGGTFTSIGSYALNTREDSEMTVDDAVINGGGIYCLGTLTIGGETTLSNTISGQHGVYGYNATVTINGGTYTSTSNNATIYAGGTTVCTINAGEFSNDTNSYLIDGANGTKYIINGGTFNGGFRSSDMTVTGGNFNNNNESGYSVTATITGGTYDESAKELFASKHIATGYAISAIEGTELYAVMPSDLTYVADGIGLNEAGEYMVLNTTGLKSLATLTNSGETFAGKTVKLDADVDLDGIDWTPIGNKSNTFQGIFDGQSHTISNLNVSKAGENYVGLFGYTSDNTISNLNVNNATISGAYHVSVISGCAFTTSLSNIKVTGTVKIDATGQDVGVATGYTYGNITDVTVDVEEGSYVKGHSYFGGVVGYSGEGNTTFTRVKSNIDVIGQAYMIGGITGMAMYGNKFIDCSCSGDVTLTNGDSSSANRWLRLGGIAGSWMDGDDSYVVTLTNCSYTGTLSSTKEDGTKATSFDYNGLVGRSYSTSGKGTLLIDGKNAAVMALESAIANVEDGGTVTLSENITVTSGSNALNITTGGNFTLDLGGKTIDAATSNAALRININNDDVTAPVEITIKNGTITAESSAYCALIAAGKSSDVTLTVNLENVKLNGSNSNGSVMKVFSNATVNVKSGTVITGADSYGCMEVMGTANIYDGAELYQNGTTSYNGNLIGVSYNGLINIYGGKGVSAKIGLIAMTSGGTINVSGGDWTAAAEVLTSQNDKNTYPDGGDSKIIVTGGKYTGNLTAWGYGDNSIALLSISEGTFTSDPTAYLSDGSTATENNGSWTVSK